jgi:hypothetical protein
MVVVPAVAAALLAALVLVVFGVFLVFAHCRLLQFRWQRGQ